MTINPTRPLQPQPGSIRTRVFDRIVNHGGRQFYATKDMAIIFSARAEDVIARNDTELVPLLHRGGVDLLLISPNTVFTVEAAVKHLRLA